MTRRPPCVDLRSAALLIAAALALFVAVAAVLAGEENDATTIDLLLGANRLPEARDAIERFLRAHPGAVRAPDLLAGLADREERLFARLPLLRRVADEYPRSPRAADALYEIVELSVLTGDAREALRAGPRFRAAWPADPRVAGCLRMEMQALLAQKRYAAAQQAIQALENAAATGADRASAWMGFAEVFLAAGKPDRARYYLEKVIASGEGDAARACVLLGRIDRAQDRDDEARDVEALRREKYPDAVQ